MDINELINAASFDDIWFELAVLNSRGCVLLANCFPCGEAGEAFLSELNDVYRVGGLTTLNDLVRLACGCVKRPPALPPPATPPAGCTDVVFASTNPQLCALPPAPPPELPPPLMPPPPSPGCADPIYAAANVEECLPKPPPPPLPPPPPASCACSIDYRTLGPQDYFTRRGRQAQLEASRYGILAAKAVSLVALSIHETATVWVRPRQPGDLGEEACLCRVPLGLELADFERKTFRQSALLDEDASIWLQDHGLMNEYGAAMGPALTEDSDEVARFFEWVVSRRKRLLLDQFSIGPTQQWLRYSGTYMEQTTCGRYDTWEALIDFYLSSNAAVAMSQIRYLDPECTGMAYPATPNGAAQVIGWLTKHTGNAASAQAYYDGTPPAHADRAYKIRMPQAKAMAIEMDYTSGM